MYRPSPVRNQRSKGIKIKHVLQVCLLVAVCFWLIFQLKRSHDKKQEFDASDPKISSSTHTKSSDEIVKFGRKDLQPKLEETTKEVEIHEEVEEQEDNKHEVEDQDEDKIEEEKDDERGGADDEIDENEQEKIKVEIDQEEMNTIDEDKETEEIEEKENENEEKDEQNQTENTGSLDDHDEDGSTVHTNEAREENYKADDASSAVTNENGNGTLDNSNGNNVGLVENGALSNTTIIQEITSESNLTSLNSTESIDAHENGPPSNTTTESTQAQNVTDGVTDYISDVLKSESNSSKTEVENEGENLENKEESLESYETKPEELDQNEIIDSDDPSHLEEKEVRTDLETLPEIETEGGNSEDTAAE